MPMWTNLAIHATHAFALATRGCGGAGKCVRLFTGHLNTVHTVAFSPDGKYLASAGEDTSVKIWDIATGRVLKTMTGHQVGCRGCGGCGVLVCWHG